MAEGKSSGLQRGSKAHSGKADCSVLLSRSRDCPKELACFLWKVGGPHQGGLWNLAPETLRASLARSPGASQSPRYNQITSRCHLLSRTFFHYSPHPHVIVLLLGWPGPSGACGALLKETQKTIMSQLSPEWGNTHLSLSIPSGPFLLFGPQCCCQEHAKCISDHLTHLVKNWG